MVLTERGIRAFDCLEFDRTLRVIDVWCDAAFLVMDCCVRGREDLGYAFIDGYLDQSGDYAGVALLPLYARYRAMVRAKVAALQLEQSFQSRKLDMLNALVAWATRQRCRGPGQLVVTCGVSGSGKSSIVFDTVATEGQRLLNENFSMFVRNFLPRFGRPDADLIANLSKWS